jgi:hypothetical protein
MNLRATARRRLYAMVTPARLRWGDCKATAKECVMAQRNDQTYDQKKGSADERVSGEKHGMPGAAIARGEGTADGGGAPAGNAKRAHGGRADDGGSEGNSPERKTARNGSDSNAG